MQDTYLYIIFGYKLSKDVAKKIEVSEDLRECRANFGDLMVSMCDHTWTPYAIGIQVLFATDDETIWDIEKFDIKILSDLLIAQLPKIQHLTGIDYSNQKPKFCISKGLFG